LPGIRVALKVDRTRVRPSPTTLGGHVRERRRALGLLQRDVAAQIGVTADTVHNWETGKTVPPIAHMPAVIRFLGYDPGPAPTTLTERMRAYRIRLGLSIAEAALRLGVDEGSWGCWERTGEIPWERYRMLVEKLLTAEGLGEVNAQHPSR
jgi:transcriptional regulator with XRE-family HTH domain